MHRRQFISLFGGIATGLMWPLRSSAQKPNMRRIGVLVVGNTDADAVSFRAELREELRKSGYIEGQNLIFDLKSAEQELDLLRMRRVSSAVLDLRTASRSSMMRSAKIPQCERTGASRRSLRLPANAYCSTQATIATFSQRTWQQKMLI